MAITNDSAVVDLGRLKTFKSKLDASMGSSSVNAATTPLPDESNYEKAVADWPASIAIGNASAANGPDSTAIGGASLADKIKSVAIGSGGRAIGDLSIAIGSDSLAFESKAVAIGSNSKAIELSSIAIGNISAANGNGSIAIGTGSSTNKADSKSVALGTSSTTTKSNQISIGNNASGLTRYLSNVKDPVDDQDAATRYWTKNADRSDVFATNYDNNVAGGTGELYLEANADLNWFAVRGYVRWDSFSTAWSNMVRLPGTSENWWIKTALKVPTTMTPQNNFMAYCSAVDFIGDQSVPYSPDNIAVGTDGYIYIGPWHMSHDSTPLGILCLGHRFYL